MIRVERHVAQDSAGNFVNHGPWTKFDERGRMIGGGEYQHGKKEGKWTRWFAANEGPMFSGPLFREFTAPFTAEAIFHEDVLHGVWKVTDSKGRKVTEWQFEKGEPHGKSLWFYPNGHVRREIPYHRGEIDGTVREFAPDGKASKQDTFYNGRRLALQTDWHEPNIKRASGWTLLAKELVKPNFDFWNGQATYTVIGKEGQNQRHGEWTWWHRNGQKQMEGRFVSDQPAGVFTWWYSNGQMQLTGEYLDGLQNGKFTWWHTNGSKMMEGEYLAGIQINNWTRWNEEGKVRETARYSSDGEQLDLKQFAVEAPASETTPSAEDEETPKSESNSFPERVVRPLIPADAGRFKR
jgi:antitoxin component YwqK of YwqJK toxin-antitoxin module